MAEGEFSYAPNGVKALIAFWAIWGVRPDELSLERIDNDSGYRKGNCKWATGTEQAENRRASRSADGRYQKIESD
jgi:hypothetical protein